MRDSYNPEGYHCLIIAILMGVNAREARFLYEHGLNNPISQKILKKKHPKIVRVWAFVPDVFCRGLCGCRTI